MSIGILQCGHPPESLIPGHGDYADMMQAMLGAGRQTVRFDVTRGQWPERAEACEAYILTGSPAGVYDDLPWIAPLLEFLRRARGRSRLVGICFGHQAMAQAFGGRVIASPKGWGLGLQQYEVRQRAAWMEPGVASVVAAAFHQDQVVTPPPGARVALASEFTPFAGLDYGDAISFQFHPEFGAAFSTALLTALSDHFGPRTGPAVATYARPHDGARVGGWIGRFLDGTAGRPAGGAALALPE